MATKIVCNRCALPKLPSEFSPDNRNKTGRQARCRTCVREVKKEQHDANRRKGLCYCGSPTAADSSMCPRHQKDAREHHRRLMSDPVWAANLNAKFRKMRLDLKMEAFRAYGGPKCVCCGESRIEFLTIDHIHGNGGVPRDATHRKGEGLYRWLKKHGWPTGFRVLCMNCNFAYGHAGYCPHEKERAALTPDSRNESAFQTPVSSTH